MWTVVSPIKELRTVDTNLVSRGKNSQPENRKTNAEKPVKLLGEETPA